MVVTTRSPEPLDTRVDAAVWVAGGQGVSDREAKEALNHKDLARGQGKRALIAMTWNKDKNGSGAWEA